MEEKDKDKVVKTVTTEQTQYDEPLQKNTYQKKTYTNEMAQQALEEAKKSAGFQSIVNQWKDKQLSLQQRQDKAIKNTKMLAWGNLFTNLAKIAGMGEAPVIPTDNTFLTKAFNEVDKLKDAYYSQRDMYNQAMENYKAQYAINHRKRFEDNEDANYKAAQKYTDDINNRITKSATKTKTVEKTDPFAQANLDIKRSELGIKKDKAESDKLVNQARIQNYEARTDKIKSDNSSKKDPFYVFDNPKDGYRYSIDISKGTDILNALARIKDKEGISEELKKTIADDMALFSKQYSYGDKRDELRSIVSRYLNEFPEEFNELLSRVPREKINNTNDDGVGFTANTSS